MNHSFDLVSDDPALYPVGASTRGTLTESAHTQRASLKLVYIAGDGRSGSTLLDRLLGLLPGVFSCGELGNLLRARSSPDACCACQAPVAECAFWCAVMRRWHAAVPDFSAHEYLELQRRFERLRCLLRPLNSRIYDGANFSRYVQYTRALLTSIARCANASVIVDSSKNPARALALSRVPGIELYLLHLVRDVRGVAYSLRIPYRFPPATGPMSGVKRRSHLRFVSTWAIINHFCERVCSQLSHRNLRVRYEDYTLRPSPSLAEIARWLGMPPMELGTNLENMLVPGHQVAGNVIRMEAVQAIAPDETWRNYFGFPGQLSMYLLVLPLMIRYGYRF
ncbi:MAG TPA: sulfotransferase [Terriglobales bacterium]|nr:sulfotransferase [Terriglobales bacterium]